MSRYVMIAREDMIPFLQRRVKELEAQRDKYYRALDILPVTEKNFEDRDALNHQIQVTIGQHSAFREIALHIQENYPLASSESAVLAAAAAKRLDEHTRRLETVLSDRRSGDDGLGGQPEVDHAQA